MLLLFLAAALSAPHFASHGVTPEAVNALVKQYGARQAVQKLADRDPADTGSMFGDYDAVLDGIASGDAQWLALAPKLQPGTDGGTAETLRIAVAKALPRNPAGVLNLIAREPSWRDACSYPMIEPTAKETRAYFGVTIPAVRAVATPSLRRARTICLMELTRAQHTH